jgi:tetratricopeptide (TPR) repeat protein
MSRGVVLFSFIALFGIAGTAQSGGEKPRVPALGNANQQSPSSIGARSMTGADARISVVRLREPRKGQRLYNKALRAWADQKPAEAERRLEQALKIYPTFPEALTLHGGIQASLQHWKAAEESLRSAIQIDPTYPPAYVVLAGVYNGQSRFEEAQGATQRALSAGADTWDVHYEIARTLIGKREYTHALTITESARP